MSKKDKEYFYKLVGEIDRQKKSSFRKNALISFIIIGIIAVLVFTNIKYLNIQQASIEENENLISELYKINNEKDSLIGGINQTLDFIEKENPNLTSETLNRIQLTKSKIEELAPLTQLKYGYTIVRYYKRPKDNPKIDTILQELGFEVNHRPINDSLSNIQINAVWYGDSVDINKVRKLALYFEKEGIHLKGINKFKEIEGFAWKSRAIEIGYDWKLDTLKKLSVQEILKSTENKEEI